MDRRSFILSSLATLSTIATAKIIAATELVAPLPAPIRQTLHIENGIGWGNMLAFDGRALDWNPRDWTWRMYYAHFWYGNPDADFEEAELKDVAYDFGIDADEDPDWLQKIERELDGIHPDNGKLNGQEDEFRFRTSSTARAYYLMKEILEQLPEESRKATQEELGLWFDESGLVLAYIGDDKAELLAEIIDTLKLPIDVKDV